MTYVDTATLADRADLCDMFMALSRECNLRGNYTVVAQTVTRLIELGSVAVLRDHFDVYGYIAFTAHNCLRTNDTLVSEVSVYLQPRARSLTNLKHLVGFVETYARLVGADAVHLGISVDHRQKALTRLYRRLGYTQTSILMKKEI